MYPLGFYSQAWLTSLMIWSCPRKLSRAIKWKRVLNSMPLAREPKWSPKWSKEWDSLVNFKRGQTNIKINKITSTSCEAKCLLQCSVKRSALKAKDFLAIWPIEHSRGLKHYIELLFWIHKWLRKSTMNFFYTCTPVLRFAKALCSQSTVPS